VRERGWKKGRGKGEWKMIVGEMKREEISGELEDKDWRKGDIER
jgi:hypothetical protein